MCTQKIMRMTVALLVGLQSILFFASQEPQEHEVDVVQSYIPQLKKLAERQFVVSLMHMIDEHADETHPLFEKYYTRMQGLDILAVKKAVNRSIYQADGQLVLAQGDLLRKAEMLEKNHMLVLLQEMGAILEVPADNINWQDKDGNTKLHKAVQAGRNISSLLGDGAECDMQNKKGETPLCIAMNKGNTQALHLLVAAGANVNISNTPDYSFLHHAIQNADLATSRLLLQAGALPNILDRVGNSPIFSLYSTQFFGNVNEQVTTKKIGAMDYFKLCQWLKVQREEKRIQFAQILLERGAEVKCVNNNKKTMLYQALKSQDIKFAEFLIQHGAHIQSECTDACLCLPHYVVAHGQLDGIRLLFDHGADFTTCKQVILAEFCMKNYCDCHCNRDNFLECNMPVTAAQLTERHPGIRAFFEELQVEKTEKECTKKRARESNSALNSEHF